MNASNHRRKRGLSQSSLETSSGASCMQMIYWEGLLRYTLEEASVKGKIGQGEAGACIVTWLRVRLQPTL